MLKVLNHGLQIGLLTVYSHLGLFIYYKNAQVVATVLHLDVIMNLFYQKYSSGLNIFELRLKY